MVLKGSAAAAAAWAPGVARREGEEAWGAWGALYVFLLL
jgi:hypothetical protein